MAVSKKDLNEELVMRGKVLGFEQVLDDVLHERYVIKKQHPVRVESNDLGSDIDIDNPTLLVILRERYKDWVIELELDMTTGHYILIFS